MPDSLFLSKLAAVLRKGGFLKVKVIPATVPIGACFQFPNLQSDQRQDQSSLRILKQK